VTDSPLCRACMEANETPTHVMLDCTGVTEQREIYLGSPATIPEVLNQQKSCAGILDGWSNEQQWEISRTSKALTCGNCPERRRRRRHLH
ncbi:jg22720, partial [Pararge aegeria aegeria]